MCASANRIAAHSVTSPGDSVTRLFGRVNELYNMSFDVAVGSITGLFGPNGAGKTTLMSIIG